MRCQYACAIRSLRPIGNSCYLASCTLKDNGKGNEGQQASKQASWTSLGENKSWEAAKFCLLSVLLGCKQGCTEIQENEHTKQLLLCFTSRKSSQTNRDCALGRAGRDHYLAEDSLDESAGTCILRQC
jgi:hypothetical protein